VVRKFRSERSVFAPNVSNLRRSQMPKKNGMVIASALAFLMCSSFALMSCSSSPDEAQMKQLNDLKAEVASLQNDVAGKEQQMGTLQKDIADKNAKLKKCHDDQEVVKQRLAK
jgi:septal ring factor EnvC (AmiA/AmiB activator)